MKKIHGETAKRTLGLCKLMTALLLSAAAKADAVLDWNVIAVNTAIANGQNPFAQRDPQRSYSWRYSNP